MPRYPRKWAAGALNLTRIFSHRTGKFSLLEGHHHFAKPFATNARALWRLFQIDKGLLDDPKGGPRAVQPLASFLKSSLNSLRETISTECMRELPQYEVKWKYRPESEFGSDGRILFQQKNLQKVTKHI